MIKRIREGTTTYHDEMVVKTVVWMLIGLFVARVMGWL